MQTNPYTPPVADVDLEPNKIEVPVEILKRIRNAWVTGIISGSITLIFTLIAMNGDQLMGFSVWNLSDVVLIFGLTFGIYKKSRTCAVVMLAYFLLSKIFRKQVPSMGAYWQSFLSTTIPMASSVRLLTINI